MNKKQIKRTKRILERQINKLKKLNLDSTSIKIDRKHCEKWSLEDAKRIISSNRNYIASI